MFNQQPVAVAAVLPLAGEAPDPWGDADESDPRAGVRGDACESPFGERSFSDGLSALGRQQPREYADQVAVRLARARGPTRRALARIAARLLENEGQAVDRLGFARLGDYARERAGMSARQLQELARVDARLGELPALERALVSGALPWSKVRLVARVASADDEAAWIGHGAAVTTRQLERDVRVVGGLRGKRDVEGEEDAPCRLAFRVTPAVLGKWRRVRETAAKASGGRQSPGQVFELAVAEAFAAAEVDPDAVELGEGAPWDGGGDVGSVAGEAPDASGAAADPGEAAAEPPGGFATAPEDAGAGASAEALPTLPALEALVNDLESADAFELDRRLRAAVALEQQLDARLAPILHLVTAREYEWSGPAYQRLADFARDQLGMGSRKARALIRVERAAHLCPPLLEAYRSGKLSWVKAQLLVPLLLLDLEGEWRPGWVAWAGKVTVRRLEEDVERVLLLRALGGRGFRRCLEQPETTREQEPEVERQMCARRDDPLASEKLVVRVPEEVANLYEALRPVLRARFEAERGRAASESDLLDRLFDHALDTWTTFDPDDRKARPIFERDGYRCAFPGCTGRANLHDHHIHFRSRGGNDALSNRITLCAFHHQRGVHANRLGVLGRAPDRMWFLLGKRPDHPPLARYRSGDVAA